VEALSLEAEVEPVIDDRAGTTATPTDVAVAIPRVPTDSPYSPAQDREKMRMWLGKGILGATGVFGLLVAAAVLSDADNADALLTGVFTPLVGLSGAFLGFYFGGKDPKS